MTALAERGDKFTAEYIPPLPPPPGKILVRAPVDAKGRPVCPDLHLSPEHAEQLMDALNEGLHAYLASIDSKDEF